MDDQIHSTIGSAEPAGDQAEAAEQPVQDKVGEQPQQEYHLPPGYVYDPATGRVFHVEPAVQQPAQSAFVQPDSSPLQPGPEQIAATQADSTQRYGQVINSVEQFLEGEATVSDVVKTLYVNTTQDDQLWKGVIVGAAAAVLLTSEPVRKAMGQTLGGVFPGLKKSQQTSEVSTAAAGNSTIESSLTSKE